MKKYVPLYILIAGIVIFLAGVAYGVYFAFPYPDLPPEEAEKFYFDTMVAQVSVFIGFGLIVFGALFGVFRILQKLLSKG